MNDQGNINWNKYIISLCPIFLIFYISNETYAIDYRAFYLAGKSVLYNLNPSVRNKLLNEFRKTIPKTKPKAKDLYEIRQFIRNNKLFKQYGVDRAIRGPIARLLYKDLGEETLKEIWYGKTLLFYSRISIVRDIVFGKHRKMRVYVNRNDNVTFILQ